MIKEKKGGMSIPRANLGGTGGHAIIDNTGTAVTPRDTLQFGDGLVTSDDNVNDMTVVDVDIEDSLNSSSDVKALSANQGKILGDSVEAIVNQYGSKNLLPYPYNETSKTENGLTFIDSGDGAVSLSGIATSAGYFIFARDSNAFKPRAGKYIFSSGVSNASTTTYLIAYNGSTFVRSLAALTTQGEVEVTIDYDGYDRVASWVDIANGADFTTPITFKPMLRDARISDDTWVPYAKTNYELTQDVSQLNSNLDKIIFWLESTATTAGQPYINISLPAGKTTTTNAICLIQRLDSRDSQTNTYVVASGIINANTIRAYLNATPGGTGALYLACLVINI